MRTVFSTIAVILLVYVISLFIPVSPRIVRNQDQVVEAAAIIENPAAYHSNTIAISGCEIVSTSYLLFAGCFTISDGAGGYLLGISNKRLDEDRCDLIAKVITIAAWEGFELTILAKVNQPSALEVEAPMWTPDRSL